MCCALLFPGLHITENDFFICLQFKLCISDCLVLYDLIPFLLSEALQNQNSIGGAQNPSIPPYLNGQVCSNQSECYRDELVNLSPDCYNLMLLLYVRVLSR